jgi:hypothetical protein
MKVYFHASVSQKDKYGKYYERIDSKLRNLGYEVDSTHAIKHTLEELLSRDRKNSIAQDYQKMLGWIFWADIVVCEISFPSTIVTGHILTRALEQGKPVLGLYHTETTPALIGGLELERFIIAEYNNINLEKVVELEIKVIENMPDQRFTMLLPTDIISHLDKVAKNGITRSEYIRKLIRNDINNKKK